ncbi:MAG: flagellar basal body rod protein FlgB [Candidatus Latescibacteria bacterium]|nr:flagellar basal body rod protein FlgB [Candidatus Latescibacterota bacterium]MCK5327002.1 flagellar basal body rod protein FlgB [Candidatus Latescibacterota bacterium]MCK5380308.1 flagellar basal body rod protein FlgB [Candidatus Latescibacterota bacterium]MCK5526762.1 flagellar basal body rod protein FlgB [Candidatus Latescibacterota bacterium]
MITEILFNKTSIPVSSKVLDATALRQRVVANNVANVTTPDYQRTEVAFEEDLREALTGREVKGARTHRDHMALGRRDVTTVKPEVFQPDDKGDPSGVNNVDIDVEMGNLAKNQLEYAVSARLLSDRIQALRRSIRGR